LHPAAFFGNLLAVNPRAFEEFVRLPFVRQYATAFSKATGVSLKIVAPDGQGQKLGPAPAPDSFCALVAATPQGCGACVETQGQLLRGAARKLLPQQIACHAGLTEVAVPVLVGGEHVATLLSGQVFRREPTERDFLMVSKMLGEAGGEWAKKARRAYFETPVITADRFQAVLELLQVFAQHLSDFAAQHALAPADADPAAIASAKQFVQSHVEEPITLQQVLGHVHVSRFYFCKLFKKVTGMTLTEYVSRVRVEKAKALLTDPSRRISEVVFAAGFGSVPRFNYVFKRHVGMAPTEYRAHLRAQSPA
jgi:AraC-like DNA-binding protein/ligand-binding sensor protein